MKVNFDCHSILANICLVDDKWQPSVLTVSAPLLTNLHQSALQPVKHPPPSSGVILSAPVDMPQTSRRIEFLPSPTVDWQPWMRVTYVSGREHLSLEPSPLASLWLPFVAYSPSVFSCPSNSTVHCHVAIVQYILPRPVANSRRSEAYWCIQQAADSSQELTRFVSSANCSVVQNSRWEFRF